MKTTLFKSFFVLLAFLGLSISGVYAADANQLKTTIETFDHGGTGALSASVSGNTVTVTGSVTDVMNDLLLNINTGVTVLWKATYVTSVSTNMCAAVSLLGSGTFEVAAGGSIVHNRNYHECAVAINVPGAGISIKVSGGTVSSTNIAIDNTYSGGVVEVSGGTVQAGGTGNAISGGSSTITISGGRILAQEGYAVNNTTGTVTISGGIGFAYGTTVTNVIDGPFTVPPVNNAVMVAWNKAAGNTAYTAGTSDDIYKLPATATAVWAKQGSDNGISVTSGTNTGFIPIEGVTVEGETGISDIEAEKISVYPNPTNGLLTIGISDMQFSDMRLFDMMGRQIPIGQSEIGQSEIRINISHLPSGAYFLKMQTASGELVQKVIKE